MIDFLYWEGCPSHERALAMLTKLMSELEIEPSELTVTEVLTQQDAARLEFIGSPTIRVDGVDPFPTGDATPGLDCRLYYHRNGKPSPLPDHDDLKEALERHANQRQ